MTENKDIKLRKLSDNEIRSISSKVAKASYKFIRKKLQAEFDHYYSAKCYPDMNDIVNASVGALVFIDANILILTRNIFHDALGEHLDFEKMMSVYLSSLSSIMDEDNKMRQKEKLN